MKRQAGIKLLAVGMVLGLLLTLASSAFAQYTRVGTANYTNAVSDRGIAVNKNPGSPYYGCIYAADSTENVIRILRPDPVEAGTDATNYVETGSTLAYVNPPAAKLLMNVFVGPDDTIWVLDYHAKQVCTGSPAGGDLTPQFSTGLKSRSIWVSGNLGAAGTKVYVAGTEYLDGMWNGKCEVAQYDGSSWSVTDLGNLGMNKPWSVTADSEGNSYWLNIDTTVSMQVIKVRPDLTVDGSFAIAKPAFANYLYCPSSIDCVRDDSDVTHPEYFYISGDIPTSCLRFDKNGNFIDGYGSTANMASAAPATYSVVDVASPEGNKNVWCDFDDKHHTYISCKVAGVNTIAKVRTPYSPNPPTDITVGNDVYGQVKVSWTPSTVRAPYDTITGYRIYRSTDTVKPSEILADVADAYPKWKDSIQGNTPGGPFYYWVSAYGNGGEGAAAGPFGPIGPVASTAPAPRSRNVALSYSEFTRLDTVEVWNFDELLDMVTKFLDVRGVDYTTLRDADPAYPNIEKDDLAGRSLLILPANREMSSYTVQCIRDYMKYSRGRIFSGYWNSECSAVKKYYGGFQLADIYGVNRTGWDCDSGGTTQPNIKFRYLKPVPGVPGVDVIFEGIPEGAVQPSMNTISIIAPLIPGSSAVVAGLWYKGDGLTNPYPTGDPKNAGMVINYKDGEAVSVYTHLLWWFRTAECAWGGTFSASKLCENVLKFFGVQFNPNLSGQNMGESKFNLGDGNRVAYGNVIVTQYVTDPLTYIRNCWVETSDRSSAIKLQLQPTYGTVVLNPGDVINVAGNLDSEYQTNTDGSKTWGDRIVKVLEIIPISTGGSVPKPLYMANKDIVGAWTANWYQNGAWAGLGLNNMGLYTTISGKVTYYTVESDPDTPGYFREIFYIDDGAGLLDGTTHDDGTGTMVPNVGVRVIIPPTAYWPLPDGFGVGRYVSVTGCSSLELVGLGGDNGIRCLRVAERDTIKMQN